MKNQLLFHKCKTKKIGLNVCCLFSLMLILFFAEGDTEHLVSIIESVDDGVVHLETKYSSTFTDRLDLFSSTSLMTGGWILLCTTNPNPAEQKTDWGFMSVGKNMSGYFAVASADFDEDMDGVSSAREIFLYSTDPKNPDTDADGIPDGWELQNGMDPLDPEDANDDFDNDGLANIDEFKIGTDPLNPDTDGDGYSDGYEVRHFADPTNHQSMPSYGSGEDVDHDGLPDWWERLFFGDLHQSGTDDLDGDGVDNLHEYFCGRHPLVGAREDAGDELKLRLGLCIERE